MELIDLKRKLGSRFLPNPDPFPDNTIRDLLSDARDTHFQPLPPTPDGVTDLRMERIWTWHGQTGLHLKSGDD